MTDRNKESLSALVDGEADELEIRRILNQLDKDDDLRESWKNYHLMGSLMRDERFDNVDLAQGINQSLDGFTDNKTTDHGAEGAGTEVFNKPQTASPWYKPMTSVAVAASVTLAVLLGVQSIEPNDGLGLAVVNSQATTQGELTASNISLEEQQALENAQQQLQDYVLKNSLESNEKGEGVLPFARVVEFQTQGK